MTRRQAVFRDWTLGTLLYASVMGFFDDYTDFLTVRSFSSLFLAALVMQALTYATLGLKRWVLSRFDGREGRAVLVAKVLSVWAIMFFSKFVFLDVIDIVFGENVQVSGFVGLALIIVVMVVASRLIEEIDRRLGAGGDGIAIEL